MLEVTRVDWKQSNPGLALGLDKARRRLNAATLQLRRCEAQLDTGDWQGAQERAFAVAAEAEKLALLGRALPAYTGAPKAMERAEDLMLGSIPYEIGFTARGWFVLKMPFLLPKKESGSAEYLRGFLYAAMRRHFEGRRPPFFPNCVLIFRHVYDRGRPERQYRDHDNIELNRVADVVAMYLLADDAPMKCQHFYCSAAGYTERTEVYVVPQRDFPEWLLAIVNVDDDGFELFPDQK